jgi:hypothetical protein
MLGSISSVPTHATSSPTSQRNVYFTLAKVHIDQRPSRAAHQMTLVLVRCYSNSGQTPVRLLCPLCATSFAV